ncbi:MAG: GAF domain-containing sensor histidine kinase [Actinobacteria bacterium]|nr:GAF domain-containing sensor histidine kinase [Actinomycetota bacterium]
MSSLRIGVCGVGRGGPCRGSDRSAGRRRGAVPPARSAGRGAGLLASLATTKGRPAVSDATIPATPGDEQDRLEAIRRYDILDTPPDGAFDRISQLAARICDVPIATITIVDEDRIWFKSTHGIEVDEIGRDPGLCASAVMQLDTWIVNDAAVDPRTLDNPLVRGELGLRFYAGVPLTTADGHGLGTLNVIDVEPRELSGDQLASLEDLAALVMDELELRIAARATVELEAAREAARFRDAIVAGVSHEMRTPLAILQGLASLDDGETQMDPVETEQVRALQRRQIRHLDWLVRQFLDYASLEDDRPPSVELAPTDLTEVVNEACDVFAGDCNIEVAVDDGLPMALADHERTRQIVFELLNNAIRFGAGADVDVTVRAGERGTVQVAVTDHGHGIAPDVLERIWDKSFRGRDSTGTGLGLYVTKVFAEAQNGRLEVESQAGEGSTFTLTLPRAAT